MRYDRKHFEINLPSEDRSGEIFSVGSMSGVLQIFEVFSCNRCLTD